MARRQDADFRLKLPIAVPSCAPTALTAPATDRPPHSAPLAHRIKRLAHLELPGAGQVTVAGQYAYVGHIPNKDRLGTSILDVSDPRGPRVVAQIKLEDPESRSHKARVVGDILIVNNLPERVAYAKLTARNRSPLRLHC